jgi:hypothetical protein
MENEANCKNDDKRGRKKMKWQNWLRSKCILKSSKKGESHNIRVIRKKSEAFRPNYRPASVYRRYLMDLFSRYGTIMDRV